MVQTKKQLEKKADDYVALYGRGDLGLTEVQKSARIEKVLGKAQAAKFKKLKMVKMNRPIIIDEDSKELKDPIPGEVMTSIKDYPDDPYYEEQNGNFKVLNIEVKGNGRMIMDTLILDGKENDIRVRSTSGLVTASDEQLAKLEENLQKEGKLKKVSERTLIIHKEKGSLDKFLADPSVDFE